VVTIKATKEKLALRFCFVSKFSITTNCNSIFTKRQLQNGVVDAYTHVMEQYLTYPHEGHLQDRIAEGILHTLLR
jgi:NADP-dependent alcohol dehydrogenase